MSALSLDDAHPRSGSATIRNAAIRQRLAQYENRELVARFQDTFNLSPGDARILFEDLKRYLYLAATRGGSLPPPPKIDDAWHQFILYTQNYRPFCLGVLGVMVHHVPASYFAPYPATQNRMRTVRQARRLFGELSDNWSLADNTNCEPIKVCDIVSQK